MSTGTIPYLMSPSPSSDDEESVTDTDMISSDYNDFFHMWHHTIPSRPQHSIFRWLSWTWTMTNQQSSLKAMLSTCGITFVANGRPTLWMALLSYQCAPCIVPSPGEKGNTAPPSKQNTSSAALLFCWKVISFRKGDHNVRLMYTYTVVLLIVNYSLTRNLYPPSSSQANKRLNPVTWSL